MVDVSGAAIPPLGVLDTSSEDARKDDILEALQSVTAQQVSAVKEFKIAFENLKHGNDDTEENKRESRRNNKKKLKYDKADELKELGEAVIVQLN